MTCQNESPPGWIPEGLTHLERCLRSRGLLAGGPLALGQHGAGLLAGGTVDQVGTTHGTNVVHNLYQKQPLSRMNRKWPIRVIVLITKLLRYAI